MTTFVCRLDGSYDQLLMQSVLSAVCFTYHCFHGPRMLCVVCFTYHCSHDPRVLCAVCFTYHCLCNNPGVLVAPVWLSRACLTGFDVLWERPVGV